MAHKVLLTAYDEKYGPPEQVIEIGTCQGDHGELLVAIDVCDYDEDHETATTKMVARVPMIRVEDLFRALVACEPSVGGMFYPNALQAQQQHGVSKADIESARRAMMQSVASMTDDEVRARVQEAKLDAEAKAVRDRYQQPEDRSE